LGRAATSALESTGEWVLVSPHRTQRPWQGQTEDKTVSTMPAYDPGCYLCPGNSRAGGELTPKYDGTYVFTNDFAALLPDGKEATLHLDGTGLLRAETERGICRVLCFHPRHDLTLATMPREQVLAVVEMWRSQVEDLSTKPDIWLHRAHRDTLKVRPRSDPKRRLTGVFATRSPDRPNPIGLHQVTVRKISKKRLRVGPIEAIDGTPVIDIKPVLCEIQKR